MDYYVNYNNILRASNYLPYGKVVVATAPTLIPVTLSEAKTHLRLDSDFSDDDTYITTLIKAGTGQVENFIRRKLMDQSLEIYYDEFPQVIDLQFGKGGSVTSIQYYDEDNTLQTLATSQYDVDVRSKIGRIYESKDGGFPNTYARPNSVIVNYRLGESDAANIEAEIKQAILIIVGRYYENRQDVIIGSQVNEVPKMVEYILTPFRLLEL